MNPAPPKPTTTTTRLRRSTRLLVPMGLVAASFGFQSEVDASTPPAAGCGAPPVTATTGAGPAASSPGESTTVAGAPATAASSAPATTAGAAAATTSAADGATTPGASAAPGSAPVTGSLLSRPDELFEITFPGEPTLNQTSQVRPEDAVTENTSSWIYELPNGILAMNVVSGDPSDVQDGPFINTITGEILPAIGGTLVSCTPITVSGQEGVEFEAEIPNTGTYVGRLFFEDARTYQIAYAGAPGSDVLLEIGPAFADSFHFTGELAVGESATATSIAPDTTATTAAPAAAGVPFTSPAGDYTVTFPSTPTDETQQATSGSGSPITITVHTATSGERAFLVSEFTLAPGETYDFEAGRDAIVANLNASGNPATLGASMPVELQGRQGIQFTVDITQPGAASGQDLVTIYTDGTTVYQLQVVGPGVIAIDDPEVAAFLGSFMFTS